MSAFKSKNVLCVCERLDKSLYECIEALNNMNRAIIEANETIKEKRNMRKFTLKDAELINEDGKYYITTKYDLETDTDFREVEVRKVPLPLNRYPKVIEETPEMLWADNNPFVPPSVWFADLGYGKIQMGPRICKGPFYFEEIISQKVQELTLEEIEQKLGCKVKIVTKKGKK